MNFPRLINSLRSDKALLQHVKQVLLRLYNSLFAKQTKIRVRKKDTGKKDRINEK